MNFADQIKSLPDQPGIYTYRNAAGEIIYIGRATSLHDRVRSYFVGNRTVTRPIEAMIHEIASIETRVTPTIIESVFLEANLIREHQPRYNVMLRDNKSFAYLVVTRDAYPRLEIIRGHDLGLNWFDDSAAIRKKFRAVFGPFRTVRLIETSLKILRDIFPYATCKPGAARACFYYQIQKCPGVCIGAVTPLQYRRDYLRPLLLFFSGKKDMLVRQWRRKLEVLSKAQRYEDAALVRDQLAALDHIQDIALIQRSYDSWGEANPILGRVEGYDISNTAGQYSVASMIVFEGGQAKKSDYRKFKIKTVQGSNDVASMAEVITRRITHAEWPMPDLFLIDGGKPQVNRVHEVLTAHGITIPILGIAKGPTRKKAEVFQIGGGALLARQARMYLQILLAARDESHRFAIQFHRARRSRGQFGT